MAEYRLFEEGTVPEYATAAWYNNRPRAHHLDEDLHRPRLVTAAGFVNRIVDDYFDQWDTVLTVVDLGAGDGGLLSLIDAGSSAWGYDLQPSNIQGAKERGVDVRLGNAVEDDIEWGDISVATECLEHLVDPHSFVRKIAEHSDYFIASSPWTETPEAHYEFHLWAWDRDGYIALLQNNGFSVLDHVTQGMFQIVRGVRK